MTFPSLSLAFLLVATASASPLKLWYNTEATTPLTQGLLIGNGRLGGIVMGNVATDTIYLDEDSLWTGDANPSGGSAYGSYQYFGTLALSLPGHASFTNFRRELDIGDSLATVTYASGGVSYTREYLASNPDQVMVIRLTASAAGAYTGTLGYTDSHSGAVTVAGNAITVSGALGNALKYGAQILVLNTGGSLSVSGGTIAFTGCDSLTIIVACGTNYVPDSTQGWKGPDPAAAIAAQASAAAAKSYSSLKSAHQSDFHALFDRVTLDLGATVADIKSLPTNERIAYAAQGADPELEQLLFQYGRYLLISSSRPGGLPANLQGLWNVSNSPPWNSDYHTNINVQMCYWGAEVANLSECHLPLMNFVRSQLPVWRLRTSSLPAASKPNGTPRGWTVRTSHNIMGGMSWNWNVSGNAWYALHFWEHYAFTGDLDYLQNVAYPLLKEVCQYWQDDLKTQADGSLVVPNGWSPEHGPFEDGTSYDQELVWNVFNNYIQASQILGLDSDFRATVTQLRDKLYKPAIGSRGQLQEWMSAGTEATYDTDPEIHRHTSHLVGLYPASELSPDKSPSLAAAAQVSLVARRETGDNQSEWAAAWRTALWARLRNGDMARHWLDLFFTWGCNPNLIGNLGGSPQWDGTFGFSGSLPEMLLQSHAGVIDLLPALPSTWLIGSVSGLKARGGYTVNLAWRYGSLVTARIQSGITGTCQVRTAQPVTVTRNGLEIPVTHPSANVTAWPATVGDIFDLVNPAPAPIPAPANPVATAGNGLVSIRWDPVSGATSYRLQRATASGGPYATVASATPGTSYIDSGLTNGMPYYYIVSARIDSSESPASAEVFATPSSASALISRASGGIALASAQNSANESAAKAFDASTATKWYDPVVGGTGWLRYRFADGSAWRITRYQVASANDVTQRDPKSWRFQASNDGTYWTTLDTQASQTFSARFQTKTYDLANASPFRFYRLDITANSGGSAYGLQLSELALFSSAADAGDKDPPILDLPANGVADATTAGGATFSYTVSATDAVSGPVTPSCTPASGSLFPIGTTTVSCSATDAAGNTATDLFTVTVRPTFAAFRTQYFTPSEQGDLSISGAAADPDHDGLSNFLEYATGSSPTLAGTIAATLGWNDDGPRLTLTFARIADPSLTYRVQATNDLASHAWTSLWSSTGSANGAGIVTVTDPAAINGKGTRFLRLQVTFP